MISLSKPDKVLPAHLTSYDLLKTMAIVLMILDHIGWYFYPDESWFRVLGRLCVPMWFFLIGYARTRDISLRALVGATLLLLFSIIAGETVFPLSILITLMIGRFFIDAWMGAGRKGGEALAGLFCILFLLALPTSILFEYGTLGFLFTVFGAMCRYRQDVPIVMENGYGRQIFLFALASFIGFTIVQSMQMTSLSAAQFFFMVFGMGLVWYALYKFRPAEFPMANLKLGKSITAALQFTGRNTLEIYVLHLIAFKIAAMNYFPERFEFLQWEWASKGMINFMKILIGT